MSLNYAQILYLTPEFSACNVTSASQLKTFLDANPATVYRSNVPLLLAADPPVFFAVNALAPVPLLHYDGLMRGSNDPLSPTDGATYIPNVYVPAVVDNSNTLIVHSSNTNIDNFHLSTDYYVRFRYDTGSIRTPKVVSLQRQPTQLIIGVEGTLIESEGSTGMQGMLQGVYVQDADRLMNVVASAHGNAIRLDSPTDGFNPDLYRILYPEASTLSDTESLLDFVARSNADQVRIGKTSQLAVSATAFSSTVLPSLSVTGEIVADELTLDTTTVTGISTNYLTGFASSGDNFLITERAAKRFVQTPRHAELLDVVVTNLQVRSNASASSLSADVASLTHVAASNVFGSNAVAHTARVTSLSTSNAIASNVSTRGFSASNATIAWVDTGSALVTSNGVWASVPVSLSNSLISRGTVTCCNVGASNVIASGARIVTLNASNASASNATVSNVVGGSATFSNVTASVRLVANDFAANNAVVSGDVSASSLRGNAMTTLQLSASNASVGNLTASNLTTSNLVTAHMFADNASACNAVIAQASMGTVTVNNATISNATVPGRLDILGAFTFPATTFVATSNVIASTLRVDEQATMAAATVETRLDAREFVCRDFSLVYGDEPRKVKSRSMGSWPLRRCAYLLQGLSMSSDEGVPVLGPHPFTDRQLLELCVGTLQHLLENESQ